ncbi:hypothetical protein PGT21_012464 [Puccinia graminis f. sp. tritici]|uniref:Uncharacterized protein n=1 Tax=Puccinia graminis f. sp. tritici TaxID=56615 RepID=A0A5B0MC56_PUCGR|nr:hypothetical protein PGT21_012464 [Puccinia graminis f. sp. tritici]
MPSVPFRLRSLGFCLNSVWLLAINIFLSFVEARPAIVPPYIEFCHPEQTFSGNQFVEQIQSLHGSFPGSSPSRDHLSHNALSSNTKRGGFSQRIGMDVDQSHQSGPKLRKEYKSPLIDLPKLNRLEHQAASDEDQTPVRPGKKLHMSVADPAELPERAPSLQRLKILSQACASSQGKQETRTHVSRVAASSSMMAADEGSSIKEPGRYWMKLYSNRHRLKSLVAQDVPSEEGKPTLPGIHWQTLYSNRHMIKTPVKATRSSSTTATLALQILAFWRKMSRSFKHSVLPETPTLRGTSTISVDDRKGKMLLELYEPGVEATTSISQANVLDAGALSTSAENPGETSSKSSPDLNLAPYTGPSNRVPRLPHEIKTAPVDEVNPRKRKHWRSAATKVRAVKALGGLDKAIHRADRFFQKLDGFINVVDKSLEHIDHVLEKAEELEHFMGLKQSDFGHL